jgi:penicillin-binding protein 2
MQAMKVIGPTRNSLAATLLVFFFVGAAFAQQKRETGQFVESAPVQVIRPAAVVRPEVVRPAAEVLVPAAGSGSGDGGQSAAGGTPAEVKAPVEILRVENLARPVDASRSERVVRPGIALPPMEGGPRGKIVEDRAVAAPADTVIPARVLRAGAVASPAREVTPAAVVTVPESAVQPGAENVAEDGDRAPRILRAGSVVAPRQDIGAPEGGVPEETQTGIDGVPSEINQTADSAQRVQPEARLVPAEDVGSAAAVAVEKAPSTGQETSSAAADIAAQRARPENASALAEGVVPAQAEVFEDAVTPVAEVLSVEHSDLEASAEEQDTVVYTTEILRPTQIIMTPQVVRTPEEIMLPDELREQQEQQQKRREGSENSEDVAVSAVGDETEAGEDAAAVESAAGTQQTGAVGQTAEEEEMVEVEEVVEEVVEIEEEELPKIETSWTTRTEAQALRLRIPAPRGQIVDSDGYPLVQNRMGYRLGLKLPFFEEPDDQAVLAAARQGLATAAEILDEEWTLEDEVILKHYQYRRWLPLLFSGTLTEAQRLKVEEAGEEAEGLLLHPIYERFYPHGEFAPHVLGAIGKVRKLPTGEIGDMEPIFELTKGRFGLEAAFNEELTGDDGQLNILYDTDGTELSREIVDRPVPGKSIVTTLNVHYQRYAEASLAKHARGGAMVVIDARGGDILAMASYPNFDPGIWVDGLSKDQWAALKDDPRTPLYAKTFQGSYPPASTFKTVIALAAIDSGRVTRSSLFPCPISMVIGDRVFRNWNKESEGMLNVVDAIKRSCNTWFYRVALDTGSDRILEVAKEVGFGQPVGLPIEGEIFGSIPSNEVQRKRYGFGIRGGDLANIAIGQGSVLATPLQVARAMAAIGTGEYLSKLRLVKQVQDIDDNIVRSYPPPVRTLLPVSQASLDLVREGMVAVVSGSNGTGGRAAIRQAQMAGKTGTAQWDLAKNRNLAWFAGFVPAVNPRFAFAAVYEGDPGESVSGGGKAAPIVHDVFRRIYGRMEADSRRDYEELEEETPVIEVEQVPVATPPQLLPLPPPPPLQEPPKQEGFFKRLFRRR